MAKLDDKRKRDPRGHWVLNLNKWSLASFAPFYGMERARLLPQQTDFIQSIGAHKISATTNIRTGP